MFDGNCRATTALAGTPPSFRGYSLRAATACEIVWCPPLEQGCSWRFNVTQVFVAQHPTEAHLVQGLLEANGIVAEVHGESLFSARGEAPATPDTLPSVWVLDDDQAERARVVLAEYGSCLLYTSDAADE